MKNITVERAKDWDEARKLLLEFKGGWCFRGQRCAKWPLSTSLERAIPLRHLKAVEEYMVREFKRRAFHYLSAEMLPADNDIVEWLALMQHHGAPTRLLDWTQSPYVAAFFALENANLNAKKDKYCAVWAIATPWCRSKGVKMLREEGVELPKPVTVWEATYVNAVFSGDRLGVFVTRPFRMNERLSIQQGYFLAPGAPNTSFEENLQAFVDDDKTNVWRIEIPVAARMEALADLNRMNINRSTLFPGIDGFAQSLSVNAEMYSNIRKNREGDTPGNGDSVDK